MDPNFELMHGLYETVITYSLQEKLQQLQNIFRIEKKHLDSNESHLSLALHLTKLIASSLAGMKGDNKKQLQAQFCNQILEVIGKHDSTFSTDAERIIDDLMYLLKVEDIRCKHLDRPGTPLTNACLFTGTSSDLSLESQLIKEIRSSDRIDIICSFIKWSGIRLLMQDLSNFTAMPNTKLRIITTSYLGVTDIKAIDFLQKLPNTELLVSYDTKRTRLHAKSYIFHRNSGFGSAYIGSSNISNPALTSGLEWNLKISQFESPYLWEKICATFETYQNSKDFSIYDDNSHERLEKALTHERRSEDKDGNFITFMDITPYPYQEEILDKLRAERELHGRTKNLIVAATGTGKTVIAAFDFKRVRKEIPNAKFLFVVHREEILKQSRGIFRNILRDQNFGELLVGESKPDNFEHLFVSIQSLNSQQLWELVGPEYYDYIIIDEFHHSAADSYQKLLKYVKPKFLLGLTATPERYDGLDILSYFDYHIAAEIRLPDAINRKLLSPFQYFGITEHSSIDLSSVSWKAGHYDNKALNSMFCENIGRAQMVIQKMTELLLDTSKCRALCFCVSREHATFMNEIFNRNNIKSAVLTSDSTTAERNNIQQKLVKYNVNVICVVDIYNEGVDIPEIDTVLFLRPTESLTVFLQQLGRGLRLHEDKDCLTVLDFVGNANRNFSFEYRFRALLGHNGQNVLDEIEEGFPHLPSGCHINLEKQAQKYILENIRHNINNGRINQLISRIATFTNDSGKQLTLSNFVDYHQLNLNEIYKRASFARLCQKANLLSDFSAPDEKLLTAGLRRIIHMNSSYQLKTLLDILNSPKEKLNSLLQDEERIMTMLHFSLWGKDSTISSLHESISKLKNNDPFFAEILDLISYLYEHTDLVTQKPNLPYSCPLELHANYTRDEILTALGNWKIGNTPDMREGVKYIPELKTDFFLITLNKSEKHYSPTTMYLDYALSDDLFHWQSQSTTSIDSKTGQRYLNHAKEGGTVLLFVREDKICRGQSSPYCFLGPAEYQSHNGTRPINIEWHLKYKMPARLCRITERMSNT